MENFVQNLSKESPIISICRTSYLAGDERGPDAVGDFSYKKKIEREMIRSTPNRSRETI